MNLSELDRRGLIAGPGETAEEFLRRAHYCLSLKEQMAKDFGDEVPFASQNSDLARPILEEAFVLTRRAYGIEPDWVPCYFSNYQLSPWHGGCAWIFQKDDETPTGAFLQLRKPFFKKSSYLGLYKRKELIAHELCHVGRMMFHEPKFEEMLAYKTSSSRMQKFLGPLIRSSVESMVFVLTVFILVLIDIMALASGYGFFLRPLMWFKLIPLGMIIFAGFRLWNCRKILKKCSNNLKRLLPRDAEAVIYRLTDEEIGQISRMKPEDITGFANKMKQTEPRWGQIYEYFRRC